MTKKRYIQIDLLKGVGMWMVLLNHSYNYVYSSELIFRMSRSCVQILLFCAGINATFKIHTVFTEAQSAGEETGIVPLLWKRFWLPRFVSILVPYIIFNTSFYILWKRHFDLETVWQYLVGFNIANPVYFIPIYFEVILCAPLVYYLVCRFKTRLGKCVLGIVSLAICIGFARHSNMFPIYGAGQYFIGATYGWSFIIGMIFGKRLLLKRSDNAHSLGCTMLIPIGVLLFWIASLKLFPEAHVNLEKMFFNIGGNPPGLDSLTEGLLLIWMIWTIATYIEYKFSNSKVMYYLVRPLISCGKYSLYIFLWHMFVKAGWNQIIAAAGLPQQSLLYAIPFYLGSTAGVIFVKKAIDYVKKDIVSVCLKDGE